MFKRICTPIVLCILLAQFAVAHSAPKIAIIIDDLGNDLRYGQELIQMPHQLTYAFLPHRPFTPRLAKMAASSGKEVMLHLPMQSAKHSPLGTNALTLELSQDEFQSIVRDSIQAVPHAKGVNNHMGSLLTRHPGHMAWLMEVLALQESGLYFVDSKTTAMTIAAQIAKEHFVPNITRDVFIDADPNEQQIWFQLRRLTRIAEKKGYAVAIAHPYPTTIKILSEYLPLLAKQGIELVPVTKIIQLNPANQWPEYSSLSQPAVKN